ncbi:hypothetical protein LOCC1_G004828 [Lachnellula occidentalis]|uniref:BZIP domain-containing protein n=1 Tax=Lachnellula occidentalis TaxID=215460 RepID=A0A8H8UFB2_9HELO|nr:hypothetical protein LOCC1_G004828 [Lachnellula occidentalis]
MCAATGSSSAASRQTVGFFAPQQSPVKSKPPCFDLDFDQIACSDAYQFGGSSALADDFFSAAPPVIQSGEWMVDSEVDINAFGTYAAEYTSLDNSLCYDSFANLDFPQSDGIMGHLPQLLVNISGTEYPNQPQSPSIPRHSPSHPSLNNTTTHDNSPQNFIISPDSQDNIPSGLSPRASVSPESNSSSSKTGNPSSRIEKRTRNTIAARRYRQKRVDQVSSLESALQKSEDEKDALKMRVARLEGELEALKALMTSKA